MRVVPLGYRCCTVFSLATNSRLLYSTIIVARWATGTVAVQVGTVGVESGRMGYGTGMCLMVPYCTCTVCPPGSSNRMKIKRAHALIEIVSRVLLVHTASKTRQTAQHAFFLRGTICRLFSHFGCRVAVADIQKAAK